MSELKTWAQMADDDAEVIACGERWKAIAANIGCTLHGFNDDYLASFTTPDGNVIEVGSRFRQLLATRTPPAADAEQAWREASSDHAETWYYIASSEPLGEEFDQAAIGAADQAAAAVIQAYGDARAREALEQAAKVAWAVEPMPEYPVEQSHLSAFHYGKDRASEAIRALKENPNG